MLRRKFGRMIKPGSSDKFGQRLYGSAVEVEHALCLVWYDQGALTPAVLRRYAGRAAVGMAGLRLDAAERKHEAACRVAPVGTQCHDARNVESAHDFTTGAELDAVTDIYADQRIVYEVQSLAQRHAEVIGKFKWRRARAALFAVDDDEVWVDLRLHHRFANGEKFPGVTNAKLKARRLAAGQPPQGSNEFHHLERRRERRMPRWRHAVDASQHAARQSDLGADLRCRQYPAVAWLGALA